MLKFSSFFLCAVLTVAGCAADMSDDSNDPSLPSESVGESDTNPEGEDSDLFFGSCQTQTSINGESRGIECERMGTSSWHCECSVNGAVDHTCEASGSRACSTSQTCCDFGEGGGGSTGGTPTPPPPSSNDFCTTFGWYGDGVCHSFCPQPDPDC